MKIPDRLLFLGVPEAGRTGRRRPTSHTLLLICGGILLFSVTASAFGGIVAAILWGVPLATYTAGRLPGAYAAWLHERLQVALGTAVGIAICVLVVWGLLLGGGPCVGWGCP